MTPPKTRQQAKLSTGCPRVPARRLRESRGSPKRALECGSSAAAFTAKAQAELAHSKARRLHCSIPGSHGRAPERLCLIPGRTPLNAYTPLSVKLLLPPRQSRGISQPISENSWQRLLLFSRVLRVPFSVACFLFSGCGAAAPTSPGAKNTGRGRRFP